MFRSAFFRARYFSQLYFGPPVELPPVQEIAFVFFRDRPAERRTLTTLRTR